ncbi:MAG: LTA synthase family protein [Paraburkholderia sp.]|uniref:LTA synthase family protein n=1 Tax=Paraburkholderia sp. TaxID=1926495 RepID=UPI001223A3B5|nr:LTA synthase family protein [Paraburkholderia sp.]TAM04817.1 MAG: LTA synthase family protein [Paraburkholderia sp.]
MATALSLLLERLAVPARPFARSLLGILLHVATMVALTALSLLVTARPLFSVFVALAAVGLVVAVNNAKFESLREPIVFTDLSLFSQLFSHPRLYLPFLSAAKIVMIAAGAVVVIAGFVLEPAMHPRPLTVPISMLAVALVMMASVARRMPMSLDPADDQCTHGFWAAFVAYLFEGLRPSVFEAFRRMVASSPFAAGRPAGQPDIVVIQSESFFDPRAAIPAIEPSVLAHFDCARNESVRFGKLSVPAWGANTMRTEFGFLTGLPDNRLGYARFYPYAFVRHACASIASWFRDAGYETLAVHPYYADFFGRNRVFPLLGFDRFVDIEQFTNAQRAGPYVSDAAVTDAIVTALDEPHDRPLFVFAMTMENHGPLHLERVTAGDPDGLHGLGDDEAWHDLTAYLRHLRNADAMIGRLLDDLRARDRETVLCFYGDHVPALGHIFDKVGSPAQASDYFIWRNFGVSASDRCDASVEALGMAVVHACEMTGCATSAARELESTT